MQWLLEKSFQELYFSQGGGGGLEQKE